MKNVVLLIEDEIKTGDILKKALETAEIEVDWAINGKEALDKLEIGKYDLVILDLKLPEISGDEILEDINDV